MEKDVEVNNWSQSLVGMTLREGREQLERTMIRKALIDHDGNIAKTAESLGVARPTMYDMIKKYQLQV